MEDVKFSERHGFAPGPSDIRIRHEAPRDLRSFVYEFAKECGLGPSRMRNVVCDELMVRPDDNNWSEYPNIDNEVQEHLDTCEWYEVYDIIEAVHQVLKHMDADRKAPQPAEARAPRFRDKMNRFLVRKGIGWQLTEQGLEVRGPEAFEAAVRPVVEGLGASGLATASDEIHKALMDLGRRPEPDITGAIQHAMAAAECVARKASGSKSTLGQIIQRHADLLPKPLDKAIEQIWGYSSEMGRHLHEGRNPSYKEAELVVMMSAAVASYMEKTLDALEE